MSTSLKTSLWKNLRGIINTMFESIFKKNLVTQEQDKISLILRLMFEIAISDGKLDKAELKLIQTKAVERENTKETVSHTIKKIIDETENSTSIYPTVKKINQEFLKEEKLDLIKELWELVSADKIIDPYEENLYFKIAELLKIPRKLANKIKQQNS